MNHFTHIIGQLNSTRMQIGWLRLLFFLVAKVCKKLTDPHATVSYSQFGEDGVIEAFFRQQENGIYVDIGCNHPIIYSNTWKLYVKGWHGVCVDPNPALIKQHKKLRPNDIAIQTVVSSNTDPVDFYFSRKSHLISGVGEKTTGAWKRTADNADIVRCHPITLSSILQTHNIPHQFELLSIDVEGHELEVLSTLDFTHFQPALIVIEMHHFDIANPQADPIYLKLMSNHYYLQSYLKPNGFFCRTPN